MSVQNFKVEGSMRIAGNWQKFCRETRGVNNRDVEEKVLSDLGSRHKLKRDEIKIDKITQIPLEELESPAMRKSTESGAHGGDK